ncbi:MAG TPA: hypothetical protein VN726_14185 [Hanamia sp.]|nr:hypothetical protein [Hanamia sp.]
MFKNYFKIAWRNLWKNKTTSFINLFGLAIGMTAVAGFCLPDKYTMVDFRSCRDNCDLNFDLSYQLTGHKSSDCESCEEFAE